MQPTGYLLQSCISIIQSFLEDPKLGKCIKWSDYSLVDFYEPVKWKELGLYDYLQFIKKPMDLTTVKVRLHFCE